MTRTPKAGKARPKPRPVTTEAIDASDPTIVERPDGYYWSGLDGAEVFGPYETYELAQAARDAISEEAVAPASDLLDAEREIGIADWIDAGTGEPAQGQSPPHLDED